MNDFEGLLATDYGFKPQGKSAPMAAMKGSSAASSGTLNFDVGSRGPSRSMGNSNSFGGSFMNDGDSIFGSLGNQKNEDTGGTGDLFAGSAFARYNSKSETPAADSPFNLDSMYPASSDTSSKYTSAPPVFDKPVYDDDIFEGVPGLKSSAKVNYDDVFASVASDTASKYTSAPPEPGCGVASSSGGNDALDDLLGGFVKVDREYKNSDRKRVDKDDNGVAGFDDLLPGVGGSRAPSGSSTSDPTMSPQPSVSSAKKMSDEADDPFKVFESAYPPESSSAQFIDPLEEISRLSRSESTKLHISSASNAKVYDDFDPFEGLGESVPVFSSKVTNRKDRSPSRTDTGTAWTPTDTDSSEKSSIRSPARSQNMTHVDRDPDFSQASFSEPAYSSNGNPSEESNVNFYMSPKDEGILESDDDVWLVVSEIPLFTQPTAAPPPSRPPPPRPMQVPKSESGSAAHTNTRRKANESSFSTSTQYSQAPRSAPAAARVPTASPFDELDDFVMGRNRGGDDELPNGVSGEELEMNTVAAAMKEAMDRAEAKFRHAKGVREREGTKATRRETAPLEREEKTVHEEREKQERLRLRKEREEKERLEKEREEKEKEQRRLEREKERVRELERERARARQAVEKATREARERAAIEARTRAERAAVQKANAEARERAERAAVQRAQAEARERAAAEAKGRAEKAASDARERANTEARTENEARLRAERAAVERAAAEARERATAASKMNQQKHDNDLESFFSMGSRPSSAPRPRTNSSDVSDNPFQNRQEPSVAKRSTEASSGIRKSSSANFVDDLSSIFGAAPSSGQFQEVEGETEERRRARLERQQRTQERAAKALAEKNERDLQTQRDQAERHRIAETLDIEIKRWAAGKEGNLRALLSTLQYVLWPECGWQPVSLTDLITGASVKKVYRKATLCIHPDKVQQKGANLQQKYIAEKVFDQLKEAWNKFNSEELF